MSEPNPKSKVPSHTGFEWAGTVARIRRVGRTSRAGRRSVLLGMLSSTYVNATPGSRSASPRAASDRS